MPVYLVDHAAFRPPDANRVSTPELTDGVEALLAAGDLATPLFEQNPAYKIPGVLQQIRKQAAAVGSTSAHLPPGLTGFLRDGGSAADVSYTAALLEARQLLFGATDLLFAQAGVADPRAEVDIVVTACTVFNPVPSMASMLVNRYALSRDVKSYHLGGMACSAGAVAVGLVKDLLAATPNATALLVLHENATAGMYHGRHAEFLGVTALMRQGAAAVLFSNKRSMRRKAKYVLQHHARVHTGADGAALACMGRADDGDGRPGIYFNAAVPACALTAINAAMARVAPKILTARQLWAAARHELKRRNDPSLPPYAPSFSECVDHFALHPGIHAMLRGFMKGLRIEPARMLPSFAALRDYANTSSASTWYVLAYIEAVTGVKKGDRVLQVGVGAGCKAGVNVYKALRSFTTPHPAWAHLAGVPVTEADLPLPMRGAELGEGMAGAVREYNAAAAGLLTGPGVTALALDKEEREKGAGPKGV